MGEKPSTPCRRGAGPRGMCHSCATEPELLVRRRRGRFRSAVPHRSSLVGVRLTLFGIILTPVFFYVPQWLAGRRGAGHAEARENQDEQ